VNGNIPHTGIPIGRRLLRLGLGLIIVTIIGFWMWPHLWTAKPAVANVEPGKFTTPQQQPMQPPPGVQKFVPPPVLPHIITAPPKAQPTPCQPCIQAANEVLTRYLNAIRHGAGTDDRQDTRVNEIPSVYPNSHPVWVPDGMANAQLHPQYLR